ncbi:MAG: in-like serine protease [Thermoleophilia bacterium]|nr:in-like serine protease [Thermoleophilia bacterium]
MHRMISAASIGVISAVLVIGLGTVEAGARDTKSPLQMPAAPVRFDADGDKVFDTLEARVDAPGGRELLDVVVLLQEPATPGWIAQLQERVGAFEVEHRYESINGFSATLHRRQVRALAREATISHVEEDAVALTTNDSAQASFGVSAARLDAGVDGDGDGNAATYSRDDLTAAVIDTGIDASHRDLDEGKVIVFRDFVNGRTTPYDDNGHGTHVAATIAGEGDAPLDLRYRGVAPAASLIGLKVLNQFGSGTTSNFTAAIDWTITNRVTYGIEAMNLSLGVPGCSDGTDAMSVAVNAAHDAGIVAAVAAGNSGAGRCTINSPGVAAKALTVGAIADLGANGFSLAPFSSRGLTADGRIKPDIVAPGVSITSAGAGTTTGYAVSSGTSMATPFAVGVALLMLDANPTMSPQAVATTMRTTAVDWGRGGDNRTAGSSGADADYGAGRLDAHAAIEAAAGHDIGAGPAMPDHVLQEGSLTGTSARIDYPLDVTDTQFPIAATLIMPSITAAASSSLNFDLYLLAPNGTQVASATTSLRQDQLGFMPTVTGRYVLSVQSRAGSGGYFVDVSAGLGADESAPTVSSVTPADGSTGVDVATNAVVAFSEGMEASATQGAFTLAPTSNPGTPAAGSFSWNGATLTFDPAAPLAAATEYTAWVSTDARGLDGNPLTAEHAWSFTTASSTYTLAPSAGVIEAGGGSLRSGSVAQLAADDAAYLEVNSTASGTRTTSWYGRFTGVAAAPSRLRVTYSGRNSRSCQQVLAIWRWTTSSWVQLDARSVGTSELLIADRAPTGALANYVSAAGEVRVRVRCTSSQRSFSARADLLRITWDA